LQPSKLPPLHKETLQHPHGNNRHHNRQIEQSVKSIAAHCGSLDELKGNDEKDDAETSSKLKGFVLRRHPHLVSPFPIVGLSALSHG
jgi:hypothetical protein